ncbi:hypothetical protein WJT86_10565 [Microvirga sp. W0021]|uniref:Uncharacterized protein n=1 Tax=Hohaiivirga grylli TaxID=3133970 RepID=A0ABV0BKI4_9HYPH
MSDEIQDKKENLKIKEYRYLILLIIFAIFVWSFKDYYVYLQTKEVMAEKDKKIAELNQIIAATHCVSFRTSYEQSEQEYRSLRKDKQADTEDKVASDPQLQAKFAEVRQQGELFLKCMGRM